MKYIALVACDCLVADCGIFDNEISAKNFLIERERYYDKHCQLQDKLIDYLNPETMNRVVITNDSGYHVYTFLHTPLSVEEYKDMRFE